MLNNNWQKKKIINSKNHQSQIYELLNNQNFIRRINKKIILDDNIEYIEFLSCSYLGLDQHERLINSVSNNIKESGLVFSSSRARMKYKGLDIFEDILNNIFDANTVIFSTTHLVHLGLIPLIASGEMPSMKLASNGCTFLLDIGVHASIQINRGLMQQFGQVEMIDFQNLSLLELKLKEIRSRSQTPLLFSDSIGSMGGVMPLEELMSLTTTYQGYLYLDDAHGMSIYGKNGSGYIMQTFNHVIPDRLILTTSLAKGFGTSGGLVVFNNKKDAHFVKMFSSTYMFSGTLINPLINACIESAHIHMSAEINELQYKLFKNIELFDKLIEKKSSIINFGYKTPIRALNIGDEDTAIKQGLYLKKNGCLTTVATYPIRKKGQAIIRMIISANHTKEDIQKICNLINLIT